METLRETAARYVYEADLDLNDATTVKQLVDVMEAYGKDVALKYYRKGVSDGILNKVERNLPDGKSVE